MYCLDASQRKHSYLHQESATQSDSVTLRVRVHLHREMIHQQNKHTNKHTNQTYNLAVWRIFQGKTAATNKVLANLRVVTGYFDFTWKWKSLYAILNWLQSVLLHLSRSKIRLTIRSARQNRKPFTILTIPLCNYQLSESKRPNNTNRQEELQQASTFIIKSPQLVNNRNTSTNHDQFHDLNMLSVFSLRFETRN